MQYLNDPLFRTIFDQLVEPRIILQPNNPDFTIVAANNAYCSSTGYNLDELKGRSIWDSFKSDSTGNNSADVLRQGLEDVLRHRTEMKLPIFRFDVLTAGKTTPRWWQVEIFPVLDDTGKIIYLNCTTYNVTIHVQDQATIMQGKRSEAAMLIRQQHVDRELLGSETALRQSQDDLETAHRETESRIAFRTKDLSDSEYRLNRIITNTSSGLCIITGPELNIELINKPLLDLWGRKAEDLIDQPLLTVFPELKGQSFPETLFDVLRTGKTIRVTAAPMIVISITGQPIDVFSDFSYDPLYDANGRVEAVLVTFNDVTALVSAREQLQQRQEELEAVNEELNAANEELTAARDEYQTLFHQLRSSEENLRLAAEAAKIGYWHLEPESKALVYNDTLAVIFGYEGKEAMTYEQAIAQVTPEFNDKIQAAIGEAITTGTYYDITYTQRRFNDGKLIWLHSFGRILPDKEGNHTLFSGLVMDVTEQIKASQAIEELNEQLRLAIASADMGTWHIDIKSGAVDFSDRLKTIFGFAAAEPMTLEDAIGQIEEAYRSKVADAINGSIAKGTPYEEIYPILNRIDGSRRWIKATGRSFIMEGADSGYFSGTVTDVTDQKMDEQRKSDFIGIVSHELRSPLTSLKGYLQIMGVRADKEKNSVNIDFANKAKRQIDKMNGLISGFLDIVRLGESKIPLKKTIFDMADLVKAAESESLATITSHKVVYHPVEFTPVNADQDKIEQVLINFINNAVKYSPEGTTINVGCITRNGMAHVSVTDEGMGIPPKDQPYIFDRFYRVEGELTKTIKGFGIGLYISKELIESHGGRIGVESIEGKGSTFWFDLPVTL